MKNKIAGLTVAVFALLATTTMRSQTFVENKLNCPVSVSVIFFDSGGQCGVAGPVTIAPGATQQYNPPGTCGTLVSSNARIFSVGTPLGTPITITPANVVPGASIGCPGSCGTGTSANFFANGGNFNYKIE